ncbi:hypothetical protein D3C81_828190 [compost metagenome]
MVLSAGAALVVLGIRANTRVLDADVQPGVFRYLSNVRPVVTGMGIPDYVQFAEDVEIHEFDDTTGVVCHEGVWMYSPSELLKQLRYLAKLPECKEGRRETDLQEISQLEQLIQGQRLTARVLA